MRRDGIVDLARSKRDTWHRAISADDVASELREWGRLRWLERMGPQWEDCHVTTSRRLLVSRTPLDLSPDPRPDNGPWYWPRHRAAVPRFFRRCARNGTLSLNATQP